MSEANNGQEMAELVAKYLNEVKRIPVTVDDLLFNSAISGTQLVLKYREAKEYYQSKTSSGDEEPK